MFRNSWLKAVVVPLAAIVAILTASQTADAQVKPFKIVGGGIADYVPLPGDPPAFHFAIGQATGLGRYYGEGEVRVDAITSPTTGEFSSAVPFVFTGANGDKLAFHYGRTDFGAEGPGVVTLHDAGGGEVIAVWVAEFTPVAAASTGRFKKVIGGSVIVTAVTEPFVLGSDDPVAYVWEGKGQLKFAKH
jgi:hypothetical protein